MLERRLNHVRDRLLDPQVDRLVSVVREDDLNQVLADIVYIAADRRQHDRPLARRLKPVHVRLEVCHRTLHRLGRLQHKRQLHLARSKQIAHLLHRRQQQLIDDRNRFPTLKRLIEVSLQTLALTINDAPMQPLLQRQII